MPEKQHAVSSAAESASVHYRCQPALERIEQRPIVLGVIFEIGVLNQHYFSVCFRKAAPQGRAFCPDFDPDRTLVGCYPQDLHPRPVFRCKPDPRLFRSAAGRPRCHLWNSRRPPRSPCRSAPRPPGAISPRSYPLRCTRELPRRALAAAALRLWVRSPGYPNPQYAAGKVFLRGWRQGEIDPCAHGVPRLSLWSSINRPPRPVWTAEQSGDRSGLFARAGRLGRGSLARQLR